MTSLRAGKRSEQTNDPNFKHAIARTNSLIHTHTHCRKCTIICVYTISTSWARVQAKQYECRWFLPNLEHNHIHRPYPPPEQTHQLWIILKWWKLNSFYIIRPKCYFVHTRNTEQKAFKQILCNCIICIRYTSDDYSISHNCYTCNYGCASFCSVYDPPAPLLFRSMDRVCTILFANLFCFQQLVCWNSS